MFVYILFCQHLGVDDRTTPAIDGLRVLIGERLREIREGLGLSQRAVALRIRAEKENAGIKYESDKTDHSFLSRMETGSGNASLNSLFELIVFGLQMDFMEFWRDLVSDDPRREREEREARALLEKVLERGPAPRAGAIAALKSSIGLGAEKANGRKLQRSPK